MYVTLRQIAEATGIRYGSFTIFWNLVNPNLPSYVVNARAGRRTPGYNVNDVVGVLEKVAPWFTKDHEARLRACAVEAPV